MTQFINKTRTDFDYEELEKIIPIAIRFMDNVNDLSLTPLEIQKRNLREKRRIGLGVMGYGSALMILQTRYGSERALQITENLMKFITNTAYQSSAKLAKEKGHFPLYNEEKYLESNFIKTLNEDTKDLIKKYGIRNSHLISIQPTGHTAIVANIVSGGLEPLFFPEYTRTSIVPHIPEGMNIPYNINFDNNTFETKEGPIKWNFVKEGDESVLRSDKEFNGYIYKFDKNRGLLRETQVEDYAVRILKQTNEWDPQARWAATAMTPLSVYDHINTMRVFTTFVDSAVSKTTNIPNNYPYKDFKNIYLLAHSTGTIKGITTYREGTMTYVLSTNNKDTNEKLKRPKELECSVNIINVNNESWVVLIGEYNAKPYEVFAFKQNKIRLSEKIKRGKLIRITEEKNKKNTYNLETEYIVVEDLKSHFENDEQSALTRMISLNLKAGVDINEIYEQLLKSEGSVVSFAMSIARTLSKYVSDISDHKCEECGDNEGLEFMEGCITCKNCGNSKCT